MALAKSKIEIEEEFRANERIKIGKYHDEKVKMKSVILELERKIKILNLSNHHDEKMLLILKMQNDGFEPNIELTEAQAWTETFDRLYKKVVNLESSIVSVRGKLSNGGFSENFKTQLLQAIQNITENPTSFGKGTLFHDLKSTVEGLRNLVIEQQEKLTKYSFAVNSNHPLSFRLRFDTLIDEWAEQKIPALLHRTFKVIVEEDVKNEIKESFKSLYPSTKPSISSVEVQPPADGADKSTQTANPSRLDEEFVKESQIGGYLGQISETEAITTPKKDHSPTMAEKSVNQSSNFPTKKHSLIAHEGLLQHSNVQEEKREENKEMKHNATADTEMKEEKVSSDNLYFEEVRLSQSNMQWFKKLQKLRNELNSEREKNILTNLKLKDLEIKMRSHSGQKATKTSISQDIAISSNNMNNKIEQGYDTNVDRAQHYWYGCGRCQRRVKEVEAQLQQLLRQQRGPMSVFPGKK